MNPAPPPFWVVFWVASPWRRLLTLIGVAALWFLIFGNPLVSLERTWLGQTQKLRAWAGLAPAVDRAIIHLDVPWDEIERHATPAEEYLYVAGLLRTAGGLGAKVIVLDLVFTRGTPADAEAMLATVAELARNGTTVVFAEAELEATMRGRRVRSFSFLRERLEPAGLMNVQADGDGFFRHYSLASWHGAALDPSMALSAYLAWREIAWQGVKMHPESQIIEWEELSMDGSTLEARKLPLGQVLLDFRQGWSGKGPAAFPHFTPAQMSAVASEKKEGARPWDDRVVLLSYVSPGVSDTGATPFGANEPRVLLHSTALNQLIQKKQPRLTPLWCDLLLLGVLILPGFGWMSGQTPWRLLVTGALGFILLAAADVALLWKTDWVPPGVLLGSLWGLAVALELTRQRTAVWLEKDKLRDTMGFFFSPRVCERVEQLAGAMEAREAEITILLTDLRGFTPLSELLNPRGILALLNQVFTVEVSAAMEEEGTMEHFLGDQFLAYWGAFETKGEPQSLSDAANRAMRSALKIIAELDALAARQPAQVKEHFGFGLALHSGSCLVGVKGAAQRMDFGIVGDLINTAARVESLTKAYGVKMLITQQVLALLTDPPPVRLVDRVIAKGKSAPIDLYEVDVSGDPEFPGKCEAYRQAFALYRAGKFEPAAEGFQSLAERGDAPSKVLADRCRRFQKGEESPQQWNGIYAWPTK